MKYLILLLLLTGCGKSSKNPEKAAEYINKAATVYCSCRNGIKELKIDTYSSLKDTGVVVCNNGEYQTSIEDITIVCGKTVK